MTMKFTLEDTAVVLKHVRTTMAVNDGLTVMQAYEMVEAVVNRAYPGRPPGTYVSSRNEVCPIVAPHPESAPVKRLVPVSIEALVEVDGDVNEAEIEVSPDDPTELSMDTIPVQLHVDEGEVGIVPEITWEDEVLEEANSEKADDGVMLECE